MLQYVVVSCSAAQCVAVRHSVSQCGTVCCNVLQRLAVCCSVLKCGTVCCSVLQCAAVYCNVLQCVVFHNSPPSYHAENLSGFSTYPEHLHIHENDDRNVIYLYTRVHTYIFQVCAGVQDTPKYYRFH